MYNKNIDRWGNEILNGGGAPDFVPTPIGYIPTATGNTANLNEFVIDTNGEMWFIDKDGDAFKINTSAETITTITNAKTAGNRIATYTNEAGTVVDVYETVTSIGTITYDSATGKLTIPYTDETGVAVNHEITLPVQVVTTLTNTVLGHTIGSYTNEAGVSVDIKETITSMVDNLDGTFTYTDEAGATHIFDLNPLKGDVYKTTSTTCQDIVSTGNVTLTVATGLAYTVEQDVILYASAGNHMHGKVVSYNDVTGELVVEIHQKEGSGNYCAWTVNLDAIKLAEVSVYFNTNDPITAGQVGIEGDLWYQTDGTSATTNIIATWVYDVANGWVKIPSTENVSFGTSVPTVAGREGDEYFITSDGSASGTITAQYIYDAQSATWVLRPSGGGSSVSAVWTSATTDPTATGNTGTLPRFVENTTNSSKWYIDSTGVAKLIEGVATATGQNVYFDSTNPATGTIFDTENPPVTNNDALKNDSANTYYGTDGSVWTWNGTTYVTKVYSFPIDQTDVFTATAGQTAFTLSKSPIGKVYGYRNGVKLPTAFTWVGTAVTYVPANNGGKTIDAGDVISFEYEAY